MSKPHVDLELQKWKQFRAEMPISETYAYFDHAAVAPLPARTRQAVMDWVDDATRHGDMNWPAWAGRIETVRTTVAQIINAETSEIALVPNTTTGINYVSQGLDWKQGDNIVTPAGEFPSNLLPWLALEELGVEIRRVPVGPAGELDLNQLAEACDSRTRLVTASWVAYSSGFRIDVEKVAQIAHDHGALFFLDAIQGLGVFPLDVAKQGVDFLAADGHKWMLGPEGAGIFYCGHQNLNLLKPANIGWNSVENSHDFTQTTLHLRNEVGRFEGGSQNMIGFHALGASLDLLVELGLGPEGNPIGQRVLEVTDLLCERLLENGATIHSSREPGESSGIVSWDIPGHDPDKSRRKLVAAGVMVSHRGGRLRVAAHAYNNQDDIERLVDEVKKIVAG